MLTDSEKFRVLMVGVDKNRVGGMWTVAETFITNTEYNEKADLIYISTSTCGSKLKRAAKMLAGYIKILYFLIFGNIEVVHIHMAEKGSVYRKGVVVYLAKAFKKQVVVQMHAGPILAWFETLSEKYRKRVLHIFNKADCMLVLGEYWRKQISKLIPENKVKILYNGAEAADTNPYNGEGTVIAFLGLIKKEKGTYDLVDAIERIDSRLPDEVKVYLCGVDEGNRMADYIDELHLNSRIVMPGWITKAERLELFGKTQMCVLPSYSEALSMTVIEAMCYGIPMVTTNITTMPEVLDNIIELVEPGNVDQLAQLILSLSNDKMKRLNISDKEFSRVKEKFSISNMIRDTLCVYGELVVKGEME